MNGQKLLANVGFYALVVVIVVFSVLTTRSSPPSRPGPNFSEVNYLPKAFNWRRASW